MGEYIYREEKGAQDLALDTFPKVSKCTLTEGASSRLGRIDGETGRKPNG